MLLIVRIISASRMMATITSNVSHKWSYRARHTPIVCDANGIHNFPQRLYRARGAYIMCVMEPYHARDSLRDDLRG